MTIFRLSPTILSLAVAAFALPLRATSQSNDASSLLNLELAFGIDTVAEDNATKEMELFRKERRWQDLAVAASNAVQRWPRQEFFENWLSALSNMRDFDSQPVVIQLYMEKVPQNRQYLRERWVSAMRQAKRSREAIDSLSAWIRENPRDLSLCRCLAGELSQEKRFDEAVRTLRDSMEYVADAGSRHSVSMAIVDILETKGDMAAAAKEAEQAIADIAGHRESRYLLPGTVHRLVRILQRSNGLDTYLAALQKRFESNSNDKTLILLLAEAATATGDKDAAVKYRRLLADQTEDLHSLTQLREALERAGSTNDEAQVIEKILDLNARDGFQNISLIERLATIHASTGATERAWALLDAALKTQQNPEAYNRASGVALRAGDKKKANQWIDAALKLKPRGYTGHLIAMQLVALDRCNEAMDLTFPPDGKLDPGSHHYVTQIVRALAKQGRSDELLKRLSHLSDAQSTNAVVWKTLAAAHESANDYTNAAACWKQVVKLTGNDYDYQRWMAMVDRTGDLDTRFEAITEYEKKFPERRGMSSYSLLNMAKVLQAKKETNRLEAISDMLLADPKWDVQHENMGRIFDALAMPDRAIRHLQTGLDNFEKNNLIPQGDHMRRQLIPLLLKYDRKDELVKCLEGAARHAGAIAISRGTLAKCADAIGPATWSEVVSRGETPDASVTQQVMAVYMLSGSNMTDRAREVLLRSYTDNPRQGIFNMIRDSYSQARDRDAVLSLYTNHLARLPSAGKDQAFVLGMLSAFANSDPAAGVPFAKQAVEAYSDGRHTDVVLEAARLLQKADRYEETVAVLTNMLAGSGTGYIFARLASTCDEMGRPAAGALAAFYGKSVLKQPYEQSECDRVLDRIARKSAALHEIITLAETAMDGKPVDCLYADKVDWQAIHAWATEASGDYAKAVAFHRAAYERNPSPVGARRLASILFKAGSTDDAIAMQTRATDESQGGDKFKARMELIRMLVADRRYTQVGPRLDEALASSPDAATRKELTDLKSEIEVGTRQDEFVRKALDKANENPKDAAAQRSAAQALRLTSRPRKAAEYYLRALSVEDQTPTRWDLAFVLAAAGQHQEAIDQYRILLDRDISPQERDSAIKAVAEEYVAANEAAKALEFLTGSLDKVRTPAVRKWVEERIRTLRDTKK